MTVLNEYSVTFCLTTTKAGIYLMLPSEPEPYRMTLLHLLVCFAAVTQVGNWIKVGEAGGPRQLASGKGCFFVDIL